MTIEEKVKEEILRQYKSIRAFTQAINVPYSTVDTMLKRGINGTGVSTVIKVCQGLNIDTDALSRNEIKSRMGSISLQDQAHLQKYRSLNEVGQRKADDYVSDLADNPKYQMGNKPPPERAIQAAQIKGALQKSMEVAVEVTDLFINRTCRKSGD